MPSLVGGGGRGGGGGGGGRDTAVLVLGLGTRWRRGVVTPQTANLPPGKRPGMHCRGDY